MIFHRTQSLLAILLGAFIAASCSNLMKSMSALTALQKGLTEKYGDQVNVKLHNSTLLSVSFINSPLNKGDSAKRLERAHDAARFVAQHYQGIKAVEQVWIVFMAAETRYIFIHYTAGIQSFVFDRNGSPLTNEPYAADPSADPRAPIARFSPRTNETDVSITRIQLEGDMKKGIALVPHFIVHGDARQANQQTTAPEFVVLDFASYSDKPKFSEKEAIEVYCDDQLTMKGSARLLSKDESATEETIAQFLTARVTYREFYRMAKARKLQIRLGSSRFDLLREDLDALRRMSDYTSAPR